jgi:hypothetical protein
MIISASDYRRSKINEKSKNKGSENSNADDCSSKAKDLRKSKKEAWLSSTKKKRMTKPVQTKPSSTSASEAVKEMTKKVNRTRHTRARNPKAEIEAKRI